METYELVKTIHILSSTLLFGTGLGTAFHMWFTHMRGNLQAIASTANNVVLADWLFTATSGVVQPLTGLWLLFQAGYDPDASWLVLTYFLYILAGGCWLIVVKIQLKIAGIATRCVQYGLDLPPEYFTLMRNWFLLGWPAFISLVVIFWLMVTKPTLW